jgi:hypothetical protein
LTEQPHEGRRAFGGFIGPRTLLGLVRNTAPWLFDDSAPRFAAPPERRGARLIEEAAGALGWWAVLRHSTLEATPEPDAAGYADYFALCLAAHFASVATFVPTDVDTKIRAHLWFLRRPDEERDRLRRLALGLSAWEVRGVTARGVELPELGFISGHDGERLSVLGGGLLAHLHCGDAAGAAELEDAMDAELRREAAAFQALSARPGRERELLVLAALMTHNAGDVDQGLSAHEGRRLGELQRERFARLAHEGKHRYGGAFTRAAALYKELLAAEGHRHYPLRELKPLRVSPDLLSPIGPFFDAWGETLARFPGWDLPTRAEVVAGIAAGCRKIQGQQAYYRALCGFGQVFPGGLDAIARLLPASAQKDLREPELRRQVAVRRESFESSLGKRARALLTRMA